MGMAYLKVSMVTVPMESHTYKIDFHTVCINTHLCCVRAEACGQPSALVQRLRESAVITCMPYFGHVESKARL